MPSWRQRIISVTTTFFGRQSRTAGPACLYRNCIQAYQCQGLYGRRSGLCTGSLADCLFPVRLVRPLDLIRNYPSGGKRETAGERRNNLVRLLEAGNDRLFIQEIKKQGGVLVNLASAEMKDLLDWKRVCNEVKVVTPEFQVYKNGKPATVVIYAKMCRGEMTRFLLKNRITDTEALKVSNGRALRSTKKRATSTGWYSLFSRKFFLGSSSRTITRDITSPF